MLYESVPQCMSYKFRMQGPMGKNRAGFFEGGLVSQKTLYGAEDAGVGLDTAAQGFSCIFSTRYSGKPLATFMLFIFVEIVKRRCTAVVCEVVCCMEVRHVP